VNIATKDANAVKDSVVDKISRLADVDVFFQVDVPLQQIIPRHLMIGLLYEILGDCDRVDLNDPELEKGKPLMQALSLRKSVREFSEKDLSTRELSNLLWAACGVNRKETGKRTAPTAFNNQEISIYVIKKDGASVYMPETHMLKSLTEKDLRELAGTQGYVKTAPVNFIYVSDFSKMDSISENLREIISYADTGFISQNVYLYCASEGLATVIRASVDKDKLSKALGLNKDQHIILAQSIGYPK